MAERKLKIALPLGKLVESNKWNVASVLKQAGIIDYYKEVGGVVHHEVLDPEIRPSFLKPRDISLYLSRGVCDVGITGKDLVEDGKINLEELSDLGCGYVDLCFMTSKRIWQDVQTFWSPEEVKEHKRLDMSFKGISLFLTYAGIRCFDQGHTFNSYTGLPTTTYIVCGTEYPSILEKHIRTLKYARHLFLPGVHKLVSRHRRKFYTGKLAGIELFLAHGQTEQLLKDGAVDFILETVATGDSSRDFAVIEKILDSTARMYLRPYNQKEGRQDYFWKRQKAQELKERIEAVTKDISNYCQVRTIFSTQTLNKGYDKICTDSLMHKKDIPDLKKYAEQMFAAGYYVYLPWLDDMPILPMSMSCCDLLPLLKYCPTTRGVNSTEFFSQILNKDGSWEGGSTFCTAPTPIYPTCDVSKLRPEHRHQARLFELGKS